MRKLLSFFRKKPKSGSLEEAQMKLSNTPYPSTHPRAEFKTQLLHNLLEARRHNTSSMVSAHSFTWPSWLKLKLALPVLAAVVIVVLVVPLLSPFLGNDSFLLVDRAYAAEAITITPTASDVTGIEAQTTFKLTSKTPLDADELKKHLSFVPELKFDLNKTSDTEYEIRPTETLEPATVYNIVVDAAYLNENNIIIPKEYRFAFQVKDIFKIARTVPGNKTNYIPVASGIEVTFSHEGVTVDDFKKHFSITPSVAGTFKKNGKTLVFVPSGKLKELTAYTVTVSKGLVLGGAAQQLTEDYSFAFFTTDAYEVDSTPSARFDYKYKDFQSFAPSEKLSFSLYARGKGMPKNVVLKIYKFANTEDVLNRSVRNALVPDWVCENCSTNRVNISGMREFYTQTIEEIQSEGYKLSFPEIKDTGVYVAQLSGNGETYDDLIFQVSQLRGFVLGSVTESILWIQNQTARTPSKGSKITFVNSDKSLTTNDEGIGRFKTPACDETQKTDVAIITAASQSLLLPMPRNCVQGAVTNSEFGYSGTRSDYWFTLSTDRSLYLPDDTVNIWGVAQRRAGHSGEDLTIELKSYNNDKPVAKTTVHSNDIGTFEGVLPLKYLSPSTYTMYVRTEKGELVGTHTIQVATFQKPTYRFTITPDKKVVWNGDTATMSIDASFFDGTPIPNLGIDVSTFTTFKDFPRKLTTDEKGHATFTFDTKKMPKNETKYHYLTTWSSFTFTPENAEYGDISETVGITILNSDYNLDLQRDGKIIKGIVNAVDITKYDSNQSYLTDPISGLKVTVMVYKEVEEKTTYQEYDDILKQNVERTKSSQHEVFVTNLTADTDKKGQFSLNYAYDPDTVYRFVAFAYDKKGRETQSSLYYYPTSGSNEDSSYSYYSIQDVKALEKSGNAPKYKEGEKVELVMQRNAKAITEKKGQFLFYTMQAGLMDFAFSDTSRYSFTFEKKHIPNVNVGAVWFDGTYFKFSSYESLIQFDQDEHKIDVNISTDNKTYKPGQKVKVEVQTKTTDGDAISADVNIKAVDEAMYAIQESYFNPEDPLTELYQTLYSGVTLISSTSPDPTDTSDGGKGGGGDGDGITRNLFKITPLFKTVHTDGNGKATVEFDMPHDITAYRLTAQAVSKDLYAGMGRVTLPVTKDFFADVTMNTAYSTQDKPQIRLRGFGDQLKQDQEVKFEISAATLGIDKQSMSAKGSNPLWIALPSLPLGTHTIKVTAQAGDLKDVIEKQVTIVDAFAKVPATKVYDATTGMSFTDIPEAAKRIQLTFSLQPYATFAQMLYRLSNTSYGRLDLQVAATRAQQIMAEDPSKVTQDPLLMYQAPNGGLRLFLYGDADLSVGFKAAGSVKERIDASRLEQYFDGIISGAKSNLDEITMALAGKAALKLPVLNDLVLFQQYQQKNLSTEGKLVLAFGFAQLGDSARARTLLDEVIAKFTQKEGQAIFLNISKDMESNKQLTGLAAATAALIDHESALALLKATQQFVPTTNTNAIEQIIAIDAFLKRGAPVQKGSLKYDIAGDGDSVSIERAETVTISVSPDELKNLHVTSVEGPMAIAATYDIALSQAPESNTSTLSISRVYEQNGKEAKVLQEGSIVKVILLPRIQEKLKGGIDIIDTLPAGLLPVTTLSYNPYDYGSKTIPLYYPTRIDGQRVVIHVSDYGYRSISYLARVVSKGTYVVEPVVIQSSADPTRRSISTFGTIEIK